MHKPKFEDPQVAHARLAQRGEYWTWNQRLRGPGSIFTRVNILSLDFLFSGSKASDANIGIVTNVVCL